MEKEIVAVDTDGSAKWVFGSITSAAKMVHRSFKCVSQALNGHIGICAGYKWMLKTDYDRMFFEHGIESMAWKPDPNHDRYTGQFAKGCVPKLNITEHTRKIRSEVMKRLLRENKMHRQRSGRAIPVVCLDNNKVYSSYSECAKELGLCLDTLYRCGSRRIKGYRIMRKSTYDKMIKI